MHRKWTTDARFRQWQIWPCSLELVTRVGKLNYGVRACCTRHPTLASLYDHQLDLLAASEFRPTIRDFRVALLYATETLLFDNFAWSIHCALCIVHSKRKCTLIRGTCVARSRSHYGCAVHSKYVTRIFEQIIFDEHDCFLCFFFICSSIDASQWPTDAIRASLVLIQSTVALW